MRLCVITSFQSLSLAMDALDPVPATELLRR